ncbi:MAG: hypothetical protein IPI81_06470 [Flavobacteriales bacterium]|nr:hypothetical protein [Flavobacteriales bacterium]MCC6937270.1 hypothetical protein [Flavobacteriales bacterium]
MRIRSFILPILLIILGTVLLLLGIIMKQGAWVALGASLTMITGVIAIFLKLGVIQRKVGFTIGIACTAVAILLAFRNYHEVSTVRGDTNERSTGPQAGADNTH